jgi:membrane-associated phospholipid phosphatase
VYVKNLLLLLRSNRSFVISFGIIWLTALYFQLTTPQFELSQAVNGSHSPFGDLLMEYLTYAGDGFFLLLTGVIIVVLNRKLWLVTLLSLSIPSIITQLLKNFVFAHHHRPAILMADIPGLHYIEGMYMNQFNSFPSGHTTAAFSLYTLLALLSMRKQWGVAWAVIASAVAVSRVYLLQHFWQDIVAGAFIGTVTTILIVTFFTSTITSYYGSKK